MKKSYRDKLRDPRWQRKRLERFDAEGWKCQECGESERELHVHHVHYIPGCDPWEYSDGELIVLCDNCHAKKHKKPGSEKCETAIRNNLAPEMIDLDERIMNGEVSADEAVAILNEFHLKNKKRIEERKARVQRCRESGR